MYNAFKVLALIGLIIHTILNFISATSFFNRIFIGISILILLLPKKYWGIYILPVILTLAGTIAGGYLLWVRYFY